MDKKLPPVSPVDVPGFRLVLIFSLLLIAAVLAGCQTVNQKTTSGPLYSYRADMQMNLGGAQFDGTGVWKLSGPVDIILRSPVALDRLQITSCARQDVIQNAPQIYTYHYVPVHAELESACPLYIEAYSKDLLTSWGFIGFRGDETMAAHIDCNGAGYSYAGLSVCQTKAGLEQLMSFPTKVRWVAENSCHMTTADGGQNFKMQPQKGFCRASFTDNGKWHRLILLGYDSVLVRVK